MGGIGRPTIDLSREGIYLLVAVQTPDATDMERRWDEAAEEGGDILRGAEWYDSFAHGGYFSLCGRLPSEGPPRELIERLAAEIQELLLPGETLHIDWADLAGAPVNTTTRRKK